MQQLHVSATAMQYEGYLIDFSSNLTATINRALISPSRGSSKFSENLFQLTESSVHS